MHLKARLLACLCLATPLAAAPGARAQSVEDLQLMSIAELGDIDVSSVTKTMQSLSEAPAAIYVITRDEVARSGATSIPEMLRLAPNLQVAQTSANAYVITARGFNGQPEAQNFSNKLLVLIDGRTVYTPLYSGVYWDMQDVVAEDIDRIEVISGPGATLWGANAVNGVINIITRRSDETQGGLLEVNAGTFEGGATLRYGGRLGDDVTFRLYGKGLLEGDTRTVTGAHADDAWHKAQGGFRFDWTPPSGDVVTLQGDAYKGSRAQPGRDEDIYGRNLLVRWNHPGRNGSALQVQGFYDRTERSTDIGAGPRPGFVINTFDLDVQHSFSLGSRNTIVWGGGYRVSRFRINGTPVLYFAPPRRTLNLANAFVQDSFAITDTATLILGLKLEDDPYSGLAILPSVRLSWKPTKTAMTWAAVSKAVRSPTPFDRDVAETLNGALFLVGSSTFDTEKLTAYELGLRVQPTARLSFSVSGFYNVYDDLRSVETTPRTVLPLRWGNGMRGRTYGLEAWGDYQAASWWRLSAGFNLLETRFRFKPGSAALVPNQQGNDPQHQVTLKSSMNLGRAFTLDAALRHVGALPDPKLKAYTELNARLGWNLSDQVQLAVSGNNLLHARHQELPGPPANAAPRSFLAQLRLRF